jgi:release factor glutamine methyltransferase
VPPAADLGSTGRCFECLGLQLQVPPQVQPITGTSHLLGEAVLAEVQAGDQVLDTGAGSGVNALLAATVADRVVAVAFNPIAVAAARSG